MLLKTLSEFGWASPNSYGVCETVLTVLGPLVLASYRVLVLLQPVILPLLLLRYYYYQSIDSTWAPFWAGLA
jgi:hypothetical protein